MKGSIAPDPSARNQTDLAEKQKMLQLVGLLSVEEASQKA